MFQAKLKHEVPDAEIVLSEDKRELSLEVPGRTREVYDRLREVYPPRLQYNVMLVSGVVNCGADIGERLFAGFLLIDPYFAARRAAANVCSSLGVYRKWPSVDRVVALTHLRESDTRATRDIKLALERRSVDVVNERALPRPMLLADAILFMKQMEQLLKD